MEKIGVILVLFALASSCVFADFLNVENEVLEINLITNESCFLGQHQVFDIQRINYTQNSSRLLFSYHTTCENNSTNITKEINKYTRSNTGYCNFNQSGIHNITLTYQNTTLFFTQETLCSAQENSALQNQSSKEEISSVVNTSSPACFSKGIIQLNKHLFLADEQVEINFLFENKSNNFTITYWIETLSGEYLKKPRNTSNLNTKIHTFSSFLQEERAAKIRARITDECNTQELEELVVIQSQIQEKKVEEMKDQETQIQLLNIEQKNEREIFVQSLIHRGNSQSSVIYLRAKNNEGKILAQEKIKLLEKNSAIELESTLILEEFFEEIEIELAGLHLEDNTTLFLEKDATDISLLKTYTKQHSYEDSIVWYVRTKQTTPTLIEVNTSIDSQSKIITTLGEDTSSFELAYEGGPIQTTIYQGNTFITNKSTPQLKAIKEEKEIITQQQNISNLFVQNKVPEPLTPNISALLIEEEKNETNTQLFKPVYGLLGLLMSVGGYFLFKKS